MYSLYLSIPFCRARCAYCDFNSYAGLEGLIPAYAEALAREIRWAGSTGQRSAHTIFFGGGTPSLVPLPELTRVWAALREAFTLSVEAEMTLEANPGTVDGAYLAGVRSLGVNRLSLGVQSANAAELARLGRIHTFDEAQEAVRLARAAEFENINLDLIMGLPGQTLAVWQETLARVLELQVEHLSCYILSVEEGTPLHARVASGQWPEPDPDLAADMYEWTSETLAANGFEQYEISNWGRGQKQAASRPTVEVERPAALHPMADADFRNPAFACRHNLTYWRNESYLGFGAGAHGCVGGWRYSNVLTPQAYVERLEHGGAADFPFSPALAEKVPVSQAETMDETLMLGLRLVREGVAAEPFGRRFGTSLEERYGAVLDRLARQGLVQWTGQRARLTRAGRLLGNVVFREFV